MIYDFTSASDLVKWCDDQLHKSTRYEMGGIGRYKGRTRIFDCIGLIKCFIWNDYSTTNSKFYGKTCPDWNCEQFFKNAKEKGPISEIPEIPGIIVYQKGHVGVYIGDGVVIECTIAFEKKVLKSYFKGTHKGLPKRTTWTHWFKMPYLTYESENTSKPIVTRKTIEEIAKEVLQGKWGNGDKRKAKLQKAGYDYSKVQSKVNDLILEKIAKDVIVGKYGNGSERIRRLRNEGYDFQKVQAKVNELLRK